MKIKLENIDSDVSIQCRANIDIGVVDDYADRMTEGDDFPPVDLYGTEDHCWIGDGWHRVMAAQKIKAVDIPAVLHDGGRADALKHALGANARHGQRRTTADKRRCVAIALAEFPKLSSRAIAELCGVDDKTVAAYRPVAEIPHLTSTAKSRLSNVEPEKRRGADGKSYLARRAAKPVNEDHKAIAVTQPAEQTGRSSKPTTLRSVWMTSIKKDREAFLQWVDKERAEDLPAVCNHEIWCLVSRLRRMLKKMPSSKVYALANLFPDLHDLEVKGQQDAKRKQDKQD